MHHVFLPHIMTSSVSLTSTLRIFLTISLFYYGLITFTFHFTPYISLNMHHTRLHHIIISSLNLPSTLVTLSTSVSISSHFLQTIFHLMHFPRTLVHLIHCLQTIVHLIHFLYHIYQSPSIHIYHICLYSYDVAIQSYCHVHLSANLASES